MMMMMMMTNDSKHALTFLLYDFSPGSQRVNCRFNHNFCMSSLVFLPEALRWWAYKFK